MSDYIGTFETQPPYDSHRSFHGKALAERRDTEHGMKYVLGSYDTAVAVVTPPGETGRDAEACRVEIGMGYPSAATSRRVKELSPRTDDVFKGITPAWLRKAVKDGNPIDGAGTTWRKVYAINEL